MSIYNELDSKFSSFWMELKKRKEELHLTNQAVADSTGVPLSRIGKFFSGGISDPKLFYMVSVCKLFGFSLDQYFDLGIGLGCGHSCHEECIELKKENRQKDKMIRYLVILTFACLAIAVLTVVLFILYLIRYDISNPDFGIFTK